MFSILLKEAMKLKKIDQVGLAALIKKRYEGFSISQQLISKFLTGTRAPTWHQVVVLAHELDIPPQELLNAGIDEVRQIYQPE